MKVLKIYFFGIRRNDFYQDKIIFLYVFVQLFSFIDKSFFKMDLERVFGIILLKFESKSNKVEK